MNRSSSLPPVDEIIFHYQLIPHPEGGYYRETFRSPQGEKRSIATAIYYLLTPGCRSRWHRLKSADEMWHFYLGGPMTLFQLGPQGLQKTLLGPDFISADQKLQHLVPAGDWFGGFSCPGSPYSFVGCTVTPGFTFEDFELAKHEQLLQEFPEHRETISILI